MIVEESILINADLKKVWDTFTNLTCWKDWNSVIMDVESDVKCIESGCRLSCNFRPFLFPINATIEIQGVIPQKSISWSVKKLSLIAEHEFDFQETDKGTLVISREIFDGFIIKKAGFFMPKQKIHSLTKAFLNDLKKASEYSE